MDALDFAANAVKSLAWPATAVIAMVTFRAPLAALIGRIRRVALTGTGTVIDFRARLDALEARLQPGVPRAPFAPARVAGLLRSGLAPSATVEAGWRRLQLALEAATAPLSAAQVELVAALHGLRNQAMEVPDPGLTAADALRFEDAVARMMAQLQARPAP